MKECPACRRCFADEINHCPQDGDATTPSLLGEPILDTRYQLERRLGQGGMGVVFQARHIFLKTSHAIKVILPDLVGNDPMLVTRFRQEALAAAAIRHQNIIAVTDFGVVRGTMPFLVMEFVNGRSLQDILAEEGAMPPARAFELISAIGAGVAAAHRQNIVHRDLKPLNIMVQHEVPPSEGLKILDFGLAKIKSGELLGSFVQAKTSGLMGSPFYMAPEQWSDDEPDSRADIYSLGIILYQMLSGDVPFKGSSIPSIMKKHLTLPPPSFQSLGVQVSPQIEAVVRYALEKEVSARIPTVAEFLNQLRAAIDGKAAPVRRETGTLDPNRTFVSPVAAAKTTQLPLSQNTGSPPAIDPKTAHVSPSTMGSAARDVAVPQVQPQIAIADPEITRISQANAPRTVAANSVPRDGSAIRQDQQLFSGVESKRKINPLLYVAAAVVLLFLAGGGIGGYLLLTSGTTAAGPSNPSESPTTPPTQQFKADLIEIPGGTFEMGRNDGTPQERPQHAVEVQKFFMDRTEVTNEQYAEFVRDTNYEPPSHWVRGKPLALQEKWPVVNVSARDAEAFAEWRSRRDGVHYRLPTEEEWEYAARNGGQYKLFPWGDRWEDNKAVMKAAETKPVGSIPEGANKWGVVDLIGNVWEWTSSKASLYQGNRLGQISEATKDWVVVRGGSYSSDPNNLQIPVSATYRDWLDAGLRHPNYGFRLVRPDQ
jgi:eukaryotic-like serine/threonine-protein kinase